MTETYALEASWCGDVRIVNTPERLSTTLDDLGVCAFLSVGLKSSSLCAQGSISLLSLKASGVVHLIDIQSLGERAFSQTDKKKTSLRKILQSSSIKKLFFDVRNASHALFGLYGIRLKNVIDVQLFDVATKPASMRKYVWGLDKAVACGGVLPSMAVGDFCEARRIFAEEFITSRGGDGSRIEARPLSQSLIAHTAMDVYFLGQLYDACRAQLQSDWISRISKETNRRLSSACAPQYQPWGLHKKFGPRGWTRIHDLESGTFQESSKEQR